MSISPVGANIYVNQGASAVSSVQGDNQARADFSNAIAGEVAKAEKGEILEVRPTEETYKIDPENEHEKQKREQEEKEKENAKKVDMSDSDEISDADLNDEEKTQGINLDIEI